MRKHFSRPVPLNGNEVQLLLMDDFSGNDHIMENHIGHRATGVVYNPDYEQYGNYFPTIHPLRCDAFIYLEYMHTLHPLHLKPDGRQMPETYPLVYNTKTSLWLKQLNR